MTPPVARRRIGLSEGGAIAAETAVPAGFQAGRTPAVVLAHAAGSDMASPFLSAVHAGLAAAGYLAVKFNFPYREAGRRAPDPLPVLASSFRAVVDAVRADPTLRPGPLVIGGRSLGGRVASHLAAEGAPVAALLLLGYPLHPAGKRERLRRAHLPAITVPSLFVQGTRDALADLALLRPLLATMPGATLHVIEGGDHSFAVPRRSGRTAADVWAEIVARIVGWLETVVSVDG